MPEGPEIRLAADQVARALVNHPTTGVHFAFERLKPFESILTGRRVVAVETRGKAMLTRFDNNLAIYNHNQLYGKWFVCNTGETPDVGRQLRLAIHNHEKSALLYSASDIEVLTPQEEPHHPFLSRVGPDVLDETVTPATVRKRLLQPEFCNRQLGVLLLDQRFVAGLGNYLRSDILFVAGLHPAMRPSSCSPDALKTLAQAILKLSRQSYRTSGVTNDLNRARKLKGKGVAYDAYRFHVFNREEQPCYVCNTPIVRITVSGRRLYLCPTCQPL